MAQKVVTQEEKPAGFWHRVSIYGLEFAVAMVTLIIAVSTLSFASFALLDFVYDPSSTKFGYAALWNAASALVWVPVAFIYYVRSRSYEMRHPELVANPVRRGFVLTYQILVIITIIAFAVAAIYATLTGLVKTDIREALLGTAAPAALSALLFAGALVAFFKRPVMPPARYGAIMLVVSALIVLPVIIFSIMALRGTVSDGDKVRDLSAIHSAITDYSKGNSERTPHQLSDVNEYLPDDAQQRMGNYSYKRVDGVRYELCTQFSNKSQSRNISRPNVYTAYPLFSVYDQGYNCFKVRLSLL